MDVNRCNAVNCDKKETCNHFLAKSFLNGKVHSDDLSDICLPQYRLYIEGDRIKSFPEKSYYVKLLSFMDNVCPGEGCSHAKPYDENARPRSSRIECKLGECFSCKHPEHPKNKIFADCLSIIVTENEAFKKAGITEGTVTFPCPYCGGEYVANRYPTHGHGLGISGCKKCGFSHT